ncbi:MAG: hypothetical protein HY842_06120 [Bacteroidetes bacterium]|nr:hypothetical protein [Bacteroidota bacterium]
MRQFLCYILLVISVLSAEKTYAQRPGGSLFGGGAGGGTGGFPGSGSARGGGNGNLTLDTSDIYFFYADQPNQVFPFSDSLLGNLHQYDPIRQQAYDFASLGNLGSASRPLFFQPAWRRGFDVGLHQFDLYQLTTADVRYYKITQAYTQAGYSQGPTQGDALFNLQFSRNFANGLNLSLEHRRISNTGAYDFQKAANSAVAAGLWFHQKNGRYDGYFSYVGNAAEQENNGGAAEDLTLGLIPAFQVDVQLSSANTRYANRELAYTQYFYLNGGRKKVGSSAVDSLPLRGGQSGPVNLQDSLSVQSPSPPQVDSLPNPKSEIRNPKSQAPNPSIPQSFNPSRSFTVYHQIAWQSASYKFSDTSPDSAFYGDFLVDRRGLRHLLETKKLENTFKLQTFKLKPQTASDATGRALSAESDLLEVGLVHSIHFVQQEPVDTSAIHHLFLTARLNFSPGERLRIQSYAHLGVGANAGDFRLSGELFLNLKKIGNLRLDVVNQLYSTSLLHNRFYVTQKEIWKNSFDKTLETSLSGTYSLPQIHFSAGGQYHLLSNLVYFDSAGRPRQSGAFSILQLTVRKDFHLGPLHLENWAGLQQTTSDVLPLPQLYSKHSLYLEGKIFKKVMLTKIGVDARLASAYTPPTYQPLTGQFQLQTAQALPFTPLLDAFLSFKVKTFRFFFKIENLLAYPMQTYFYQTASYPLPFGFENGGVRFGVSWRLVD